MAVDGAVASACRVVPPGSHSDSGHPADKTIPPGPTPMKTGLILLMALELAGASPAQATGPRFRVIVLAQVGGLHAPFVDAATKWLTKLSADSNFVVDYIHTPDSITAEFLTRYQLFIQLDYPPYGWNDTAKGAFESYITNGRGGGWVGFHHATLLGEFDGFPMWRWFSDFMGGIRYVNYISTFAAGAVSVEEGTHPVMRGLPPTFRVSRDEWYTYDRSPRGEVHVLASVDEPTYDPPSEIRMGDHPVVWTNEHVGARNVYIFMGHHPDLFDNPAYTTLVRNAIFWGASH
jgi:type 1 glutamine amidotransferase